MKKNNSGSIASFAMALAIGFVILQFGCEKTAPCNGFPVFDSYFSFRLVDKHGVNLIAAWGATYLSDSVFLTKMDGTLPNELEIREDGRIVFFIPDDFEEAKDSMVTRQFLLYLPDVHGNPNDDIDTIGFKYRFEENCYDRFQVFFNDSLYHDGSYIDFISFVNN